MNIRGKGLVYRVKFLFLEEKVKKKNIMKERGVKRESGGRGWGGVVCDDGLIRFIFFFIWFIIIGFEFFFWGFYLEMIFFIYYYYIFLLIMFYFED